MFLTTPFPIFQLLEDFMYLKKEKRANGRINLSIFKSYRDPDTKKVRTKSIKNLGFLDELEKEFDDPIAHFTKLAKEMTIQEQLKNLPLELSFDLKEKISENDVNRKNLGFVVLSYFYHLLELDYFWNNRQKTVNTKFNLNQIFQFLIFSRILNPSSKKSSFESKDDYFFDFDFSLQDVYRALTKFYPYKKDLILWINDLVKVNYGRDFSNVYYDVTNYYFEIPLEDDLRKRGFSKENKNNPIVQMGLLMDKNGIPISYDLFKGNTNDSVTLLPSLHSMKESFNIKRLVVVADKAMNSGENIGYNILEGNGYIFSQTIRGASKDLKDYVLDDSDYLKVSDDFKIKSRIIPTHIWVTDINGKKKKVPIDQKQVVYYSSKYAKRAKHEREKVIDKALRMIAKGKSIASSSALSYIKEEFIDKETGEILDVETKNILNTKKIEEAAKYDGYYAIVTSELDMDDKEIIEAYRGLWKIEESFKITKSQLETRPVYLSREDRIESHFLTCFVSLVILRLLEHEMRKENIDASLEKVIEELKKITGTYLAENYYLFDHSNELVRNLGDIVGVDFSQRFLSKSSINSYISKVKKVKKIYKS